MAVRFLVIRGDEADGKSWVDCQSDGNSVNLPGDRWSTEDRKDRILHEVVVDATTPDDYPQHLCPPWAPAIEAVAKLDEANLGGRDMFHRALARVFRMGMEAQKELDKKTAESQDVANGSR